MTRQAWQILGIISALISAAIVYWALSTFTNLDGQVKLMITGIVAIIDFGALQILLKGKLK